MRRLRPLSEAECYTRCYGRGDETVRIMRVPPQPRARPPARMSGEDLRRLFEARLDSRENEAA